MSSAGVMASTAPVQGAGRGSNPTAALHYLRVQPVSSLIAKVVVERSHYLHSLPGGTKLSFGVFLGSELKGVLTLGVGPGNAHCLVEGAAPADCLTLTRLWLSDELPTNSESRVVGFVLKSLKKIYQP